LYVYDISLNFLEWELFQTIVEKIKTNTLCSINFFRKSYRLWDNVEKHCTARQARGEIIMRCIRVDCWITLATDTLSRCNTSYFLPVTMVTRTHISVTLYVHYLLCCVIFKLMALPYNRSWCSISRLMHQLIGSLSSEQNFWMWHLDLVCSIRYTL